MSKAEVTDLRKAYPDLEPDKDYPPLKFKSLKGKVSAAEWEARVDCACAYRLVRIFSLLEWPAMRRLADRIDPSYKN